MTKTCYFASFYSDLLHEDLVGGFSSQRAVIALSNLRHLTDPYDLFAVLLSTKAQTDLMHRLSFSTHKLVEDQILSLSAAELKTSVSEFLDVRPDGFALNRKTKRIAIHEFIRAMISAKLAGKERFAKKATVCAGSGISSSILEGWTMIQLSSLH